MATLLSVDPSKPGNNTGVAYFHKGQLAFAWLHTQTKAIPGPVDLLVIELPQVYPGARAEDPNDLIQVARAVGQWEQATSFQVLELVHPRTWKGTVDWRVMCRRIVQALSESERAKIPELPEGKLHNVLDAIGLGLWALGRIRRGGG